MILKTGANYQAEGGYIEASSNNGFITIVKNDEVLSFHDTASIVIGFAPIRIKNSTGAPLFPSCLGEWGGVKYIGSSISEIANGETAVVNVPLDAAFRLGYSDNDFISDNPNLEILKTGNQYYGRVVNYPDDGLSVTLTK